MAGKISGWRARTRDRDNSQDLILSKRRVDGRACCGEGLHSRGGCRHRGKAPYIFGAVAGSSWISTRSSAGPCARTASQDAGERREGGDREGGEAPTSPGRAAGRGH